jgi:hypothetical protein
MTLHEACRLIAEELEPSAGLPDSYGLFPRRSPKTSPRIAGFGHFQIEFSGFSAHDSVSFP